MMDDNLQHIENAIEELKAIKPNDEMDEGYLRQMKMMLHNMSMKYDEPPDDAICTRDVTCFDCNNAMPYGTDVWCEVSECKMDDISKPKCKGKSWEARKRQLNDNEIKLLEEHMVSDEYIDELRKKQQTDCSKCIYQISKLGNLPNEENNIGFIKDKRDATRGYGEITGCLLNLRESKPICPLFDDGKEVKQ